VAVSAYIEHLDGNVKRKGVAKAIGWTSERYYSDQVYFNECGNFGTVSVNLANGFDSWHNQVIDQTPFVACLL
jgi:hypothetical protein